MLVLCQKCGVKKDFINSEVFKKNGELDFDREIDFKLYNLIRVKNIELK